MQSKPVRKRKLLVLTLLLTCVSALFIGHTLTVARGGLPQVFGGADTPADAPTSAAAQPEPVIAEGRIVSYPGAEVMVGTEISGRITRIAVQEQQLVRAGDLLAEIACDEEQAQLQEARFRISELDAEIHLLQWELEQYAQLVGSQALSKQSWNEKQRDLEVARARHDAAQATVTRLRAHLAKARIVAPIDGTVTARFVAAGQFIEAAAPLATIADLRRLRVEAEVNEFDANRVVPGSPAAVTAEGYPDVTWRAHVEEIPDVVVGRRLRPQDPGKPSDTGVVMVKLALIDPIPLRLGQRVEVRIDGSRINSAVMPTTAPIARETGF